MLVYIYILSIWFTKIFDSLSIINIETVLKKHLTLQIYLALSYGTGTALHQHSPRPTTLNQQNPKPRKP